MPKRKFQSQLTPAQTWARRRNWCKGQTTLIRNIVTAEQFYKMLTQEEQYLADIIYVQAKNLLSTWNQSNKESKENYLAKKE